MTMFGTPFFLTLLLSAVVVFGQRQLDAHLPKHCPADKMAALDFIVTEGSSTQKVLAEAIKKDLEEVGLKVTTRYIEKDAFNAAMTSGDFNLCFSETWGPPYDPHSFAASWAVPDEAHFAALEGMEAPMKKAELMNRISQVTLIEDEGAREAAWAEILTALHGAAVDMPLSGKRNPVVMNRRLSGYRHGEQQFDYPLHRIAVNSGSKTVTVAPGAQTGLFQTVGRLDPHTYRPNEFFANNWVYESLVAYGADGIIEPALAISWTVADLSTGGQTYTFALRQGVKFHDGSAWNCDVAKLNYDHVLAKPLVTGDYHGWYDLVEQVVEWSCTSEFVFVLKTKDKYYPLIQELSYIRPLRMLSPAMFQDGITTDPKTKNSCHVGWGKIEGNGETLDCAGTLGVSGTGPWKYIESKMDGETTTEAVFERFKDHWGTVRPDGIDTMRVLRFENEDKVMAALVDGTLDVVVGSGVLKPSDFQKIKTKHTDKFQASLGPVLQNRIVILNSNKAPTDSIQVRKAVIHAVNKAAILSEEFHGIERPASTAFPKNAPYCDLDLTPRWDFDLEKAKLLLECPVVTADIDPNALKEAQDELKAEKAALEAKDAELAETRKELEEAQKNVGGEVSHGARTAQIGSWAAPTFSVLALLLVRM